MKSKSQEVIEKLASVKERADIVTVRRGKGKKATKLYNIPVAFDIETTSFYKLGAKCAIMYIWMFAVEDIVITGRTWSEFAELIDTICELFELGPHKRLVVYVHNLAYEFQFIRKRFHWDEVFALSERKPVKAITTNGIEFRCSYIESGYSLDTIGKNLKNHDIKKLTGNLDYTKIRNSATNLTNDEIAYCVNDVLVLTSYIAEKIEQCGNIAKIANTKTGYVRRYCRAACLSRGDWAYRSMIESLTITEPEEYEQLKRAFAGGYTHASAKYNDEVVENVISYDFTSSYPAVMISEQFPMSTAEKIEIVSRETLEKNLKYYCCVFDVEFVNIRPVIDYDHYISVSRCWGKSTDTLEDNGRIVSASMIKTTITEQDFAIIRKTYKWDKMRVSNFRRYKKGYLPTEFVKCIIDMYNKKTTLKGVKGMEAEYQAAKENVNSLYGMTCTDIVRPDIEYYNLGGWSKTDVPISARLEDYNTDKNRFLYYPWGVWVTAYARRNLWTGIIACGDDYLYSDTDSVKIKNAEKHDDYFTQYNRWITDKIVAACEYHGIDPALTRPKTIKGIEKPLGVWDFDGEYSKFKTLGAKRYIYSSEENSDVKITIAGLSKKAGAEYLNSLGDTFASFTDGMYIPGEYTGKMTHTYIDDTMEGYITDYQGNTVYFKELSAVHLEECPFDLSISGKYMEYLRYLKGGIL